MNKLDHFLCRAKADRAAVEAQIRDWPAPFKGIAEDLLAGRTQKACAANTGVGVPLIRAIAESIGWQPRWRAFANNSPKVVGPNRLTWEQIAEHYKSGRTLKEIGVIAGGVSRERIRQVLYYQNLVPLRDLVRPRAQQRAAKAARACEERRLLQNQQAQEEHFKHYAPWREMWAAGKSLKEMAAALNVKATSVGSTMATLRAKHPGWFPYRQPHYQS